MRIDQDGTLRLSPTDVNDFLACPHLPALQILRAEGKASPEKGPRPDAELIAARGLAHEHAFLDVLRNEGHEVVATPEEEMRVEERAGLTEEAMRDGVGVIHQAAFDHDGWRGFADFLIRLDEPSGLGTWSYEAHDAKLAAHPRPYFILQLVFYSEQIARIQGRLPKYMHLVLGTQERPSFRTRDFTAYAARVRERYLEYLEELRAGKEPPYPYPVEHCNWCDWWARCRDKRRADDHLSLVAFLTRGQAIRLEESACATVEQLAAVPDDAQVDRVAKQTLAGLRQQARLQVEARRTGENLRELLEPEHDRGLARLPDPSPGDVFFDIEGDPYWGDEGLEYLFGTVTEDGEYTPRWAHSREDERRMFEQWMDWLSERLAAHPDLHIYHYNAYEPTAVKKLMSRYGTREHEVDELLRRHVFVDLYAIVRQGMRIGKESYSLKAVEDFYGFERDAEVTEVGGSMLAYQEWIESREETKLQAIADYNADDCRSTLGLRDWLLDERDEAEREFGVEIAALEPEPARPISEDRQALLDEITHLRAALTEGLPEEEDAELNEDERARRLLADILEYHHREQKPQWWAYFDRLKKTPGELCREDTEAIGELTLAPEVELREDKKSFLYPLRFAAQEHKIGPGKAVDPATESQVTVWEVDDPAGMLWLKRAKTSHERPLPKALIPIQPIQQAEQQARLRELAARVCESGLESVGELDAACDILAGRPPRIAGLDAGEPLQDDSVSLDRLIEQVAGLEQSALFIQGPPGSGKTWTASRIVVALIQRGLRVGVTATAHKAIHKLLDDVEEAASEAEASFRGLKKSSADNPDSHYESKNIVSTSSNAAFPGDPNEYELLAGTAWLWARGQMREAVDVLFVDEGGQVALADALAITHGAKSIVVIGDPQQLAHVSQGVHPRGSGCSVLQHLLGEAPTVPPERGVFLDRTFRMHPDVCSFVSDAMYEGRLASVAGLERQRIDSPALSGAGTRIACVDHFENRQRSTEEAARIAEEVGQLLDGGRFIAADGEERDLVLDDILVVSPYNMQVRCLRQHLPAGARIGTVDKFQGQQAPVVFFSMTSSTGEDVPRGMDFLFSRNRLNVAVSRAQALSVVVCSPSLLWARCNSVEQMRLVNALCRFADGAQPI